MKYPAIRHLTQKKWISYSTLGWSFGVVMVVLTALFLEMLNLGFSSQAVVGVGMGFGVGLLQWLILNKHLKISTRWILYSTGGLGLSFILADVVFYFFELKPEIILPFATCLGALISGWFQDRKILRQIIERPSSWIFYHFVAWFVAYGVTMGLFYMSGKITHYLPSYINFIMALGFLVIGGPVFGYISWLGIVKITSTANDSEEY